jgi:hypothetical protein
MYRPCILRAPRRAADSRSLRPVLDSLEDPPSTASRAGASRASARAMEPSDLRIACRSLPTEMRRCDRKGLHLINGRIVLRALTPSANSTRRAVD